MDARALIDKLSDWAWKEEAHGVVPADEVGDALERLLKADGWTGGEEDVIERTRGLFVIDVAGRLFFKGVHIGWLRREAGDNDLREFADVTGAEYPMWTGDFLPITEGK